MLSEAPHSISSVATAKVHTACGERHFEHAQQTPVLLQARLPEEPQLPELDSPESGKQGADPLGALEADPFGLELLMPEQNL